MLIKKIADYGRKKERMNERRIIVERKKERKKDYEKGKNYERKKERKNYYGRM